MWDLIGTLLGGMLATIATGAVLVGYVLWAMSADTTARVWPIPVNSRGEGGT